MAHAARLSAGLCLMLVVGPGCVEQRDAVIPDVRAKDAGGPASGRVSPPPPAGTAPVTVMNQLSKKVCHVYAHKYDPKAYAAGAPDVWEEDLLHGKELGPGATIRLDLAPGDYTFLVQDCAGETLQKIIGHKVRADKAQYLRIAPPIVVE